MLECIFFCLHIMQTKNGQEEYDVRKLAKKIYIILAVCLSALLSSILLHEVSEQEEQEQLHIESRIPSGDYLPDSDNPLIRVVLKNNGFQELTHNEVQVCSPCGIIVTNGQTVVEYGAGEILTITPDDARFQNGTICVETKMESERITINSISRGYGTPSYEGKLEMFRTAEGIVIVNELLVEEYLCAVVPSEMPASYQIEALKCQAICARSYAYCQMLTYGYPEYSAHVDDSVSFQVYGNSLEKDSTDRAVKETTGEKLWYQKEVVKTYYYSTSCGHSTSIEAWGSPLTQGNRFLEGVPICDEDGNVYEKELPWFRWKAVVPERLMSDLIELNTGKEIGTLENLLVTKRGVGGVALQLVATGTKGEIVVQTENKIRRALGGSGYMIEKQDGSMVKSTKLLPSAFFTIAKNEGNYIIEGGGYGHGIGMSQNGANEMAKAGKTYKEILQFFYPYTEVR